MRVRVNIPKIEGTVKWFDDAKGYGFIISDGVEYFVHFSNIKMKGHRTLAKDQTVKFWPCNSDDGKPIAVAVEVL